MTAPVYVSRFGKLAVYLGLATTEQARAADEYADELAGQVERGELTLAEADALMLERARRDRNENRGAP